MDKLENLKVILYGEPEISVREVMPTDTIDIIKDKNKKPFIAIKSALLKVEYNKQIYYISNVTNYCYDGASIPFRIGKGNMKLLIPALFHDIICEDKTLVDCNRYLSSLIFRELLLQCGVNKIIAQIMFLAVDNYQKFMKGWK